MQMLCKWNKDGRVHILQYENLTSQPEKEFDTLFQFLEIPPIPYQEIYAPRSEPQVNFRENWAREHFIKASGPITTESLMKWKNQLSTRETRVIECITHSGMGKMDYELTTELGFSDYLTAFCELFELIFKKPGILVKKLSRLKRKYALKKRLN
jgi:hypothetical protein